MTMSLTSGLQPSTRTMVMDFKLSLLTVIFLVSQVQSQTVVDYNIYEEVPNGTLVGGIINDADLMNNYDSNTLADLTFRFLQENDEHIRFVIDEYSGQININDEIDRDTLCPSSDECILQHDIAILNPSGHFEVITVKFHITDINDNSPMFPEPEFFVLIPELATPGATYNLPLAVDPDSKQYSVQGYNLITDTDSFELKVTFLNGVPKTIQLSLRESVDREVKDSYEVLLEAYDGGSPAKKGQLLINVSIGDANDHGPEFSQGLYEINIPEDTPVQGSIMQLMARDQDIGPNGAVMYKFASTTDEEFTRTFGVQRNTGVIFLKEALDFEVKQNYHLMIEARDGGPNSQPAYATVVINVEDVNDNPPQILVNTLGGNLKAEISELDSPGKFIAHVSVRDPDGENGGVFECVLDNPLFKLVSLGGGRFEVHTDKYLDRETKEKYEVSIICEDKGYIVLSSSKTITVTALDENDNTPEFSQDIYTVVLEENNRINALILRVNATDKDAGWNADITYSLHDEDKELFKIDARTGIVRANSVFDFEDTNEVQFQVIATDGADPFLSSTAIINVIILDANDEPPQFDRDVFIFDVMENQPIGFEVGQVIAKDADSEPNNRVEYSLIHVSKDAESFTIDTHTGSIRTNTELNRELRSSYYLSVMATNVGVAPPLSGSTVIEVKVRDQNDNAPIIDFPREGNQTIEISNKVPVGYQVGVVQAHDVDLGVNAELTYVISPERNNGMFVIDTNTGVVVTRASLSYIDMETIKMVIEVSDRGFPSNTASAMLEVTVNSSILYHNPNPKSLLDGTNVTIVIALSIASAIIMAALILAIVFIRRRDCIKKQRMLQYQCRVEAQSESGDSEKGPPSFLNASDEDSNQNKRPSSAGSISKTSKREVNFILDNSRAGTRGSISSYQQGSQEFNQHQMTGSRQQSLWLATSVKEKMRDSQGGGRHQQPPLELDAHQLTMQTKAEDHDSDSAYSGDISNTDSGRGPSEEGETQGVPASQIPYFTPTHGRSAYPAVDIRPDPQLEPRPTTYHVTSFLPQVHHPSRNEENNRKQSNINKKLVVHDSRPKTIKQMVAGNNHHCMSEKPPPIPTRQKRIDSQSNSQRTNPQCINNKLRVPSNMNSNSYRNGYHGNRSRPSSAQSSRRSSWDDDGGSTTSGSYIVDAEDLYLEGSQQLASSVTV